MGIVIPTLASVVTFLTYAAAGNDPTPADAFTVVSLFTVIRVPFLLLPRVCMRSGRSAPRYCPQAPGVSDQ